ncbi:MAG: LamG domain-containing protein, partial [Nanoarchaeota archaeon]
MEKERLIAYFKKYQSKGYSKIALREEAQKQGWSKVDIDDALKSVTSNQFTMFSYLVFAAVVLLAVGSFLLLPKQEPTGKIVIVPPPSEFPFVNASVPLPPQQPLTVPEPTPLISVKKSGGQAAPTPVPVVTSGDVKTQPATFTRGGGGSGSGGGVSVPSTTTSPSSGGSSPLPPSFGVLDATGPVAQRVNITTFTPNSTTSVSGVWNYTDAANDAENGSTWTWFVNNTEAWRDTNLVAYFKFDNGNLNDSLGLTTGSGNFSVVNDGIIKSAVSLSGVNYAAGISYTNTSRFNMTSTNALTILAWVKGNTFRGRNASDVLNDNAEVVAKFSGGTEFDWNLGIFDNHTIANIWTIANGQLQANGTTKLLYGRWYHIGMTWGSGDIKFYVDGLADGSRLGLGGTISSSSEPLSIGRSARFNAAGFEPGNFNGSIDEVKIFNRTLTASEIANEYQMMSYGSTEKDASGSPAPDIPVALWHFDDAATSTSMFDFFGDSVGVLSNVSRIAGVYGTNGLFFNGTNAVVVVNHSQVFNLSGNFTFFAWINTSSVDKVNQYVLSKHEHTSMPSFAVLVNNSQVSCLVGNATGMVGVAATGTITNGFLYRIGCVYNSTTLGVIVDDIIRSTTASGGLVNITANAFYIGSVNGTGNFFNGTIDEVELYNRPFTVDEISQSYRRGFPAFGLNTSRFGANDSLTFQLEPIQFDGLVGSAVNSTILGT